MGEGAGTHKWLVLVHWQVSDFRDEVREAGELGQVFRRDTLLAHLELQVGDDRAQVGVAHTLPITVDRSLHVHRPGLHRCQRVGDPAAAIVMGVDTKRHG